MEIDRKFVNVLILGVAFMLIFTAFQTMGNIQVIHAPILTIQAINSYYRMQQLAKV